MNFVELHRMYFFLIPYSPYSEAYKSADNFQIEQQEPEKTFFEVRPKLGSVSFLPDQTKSQISMNFQITISSLVRARFEKSFFSLVD